MNEGEEIIIRFDPAPSAAELATLDAQWTEDELERIFRHSLCHACAYLEGLLVGYVNVAWD